MFQLGYRLRRWKVVSMTSLVAGMIFLTSVCGMNNYESCSERTDGCALFFSIFTEVIIIQRGLCRRNIKANRHLLNYQTRGSHNQERGEGATQSVYHFVPTLFKIGT